MTYVLILLFHISGSVLVYPYDHLLSLRSALFPYTTLFRSQWLAGILDPVLRAVVHAHVVAAGFEASGAVDVEQAPDATNPDRKSTRLNSSHRCISYAVFCLKKKNKTIKIKN